MQGKAANPTPTPNLEPMPNGFPRYVRKLAAAALVAPVAAVPAKKVKAVRTSSSTIWNSFSSPKLLSPSPPSPRAATSCHGRSPAAAGRDHRAADPAAVGGRPPAAGAAAAERGYTATISNDNMPVLGEPCRVCKSTSHRFRACPPITQILCNCPVAFHHVLPYCHGQSRQNIAKKAEHC